MPIEQCAEIANEIGYQISQGLPFDNLKEWYGKNLLNNDIWNFILEDTPECEILNTMRRAREECLQEAIEAAEILYYESGAYLEGIDMDSYIDNHVFN